jgi:trimethylamine--corrinoid protein Co-methyltransferase
MTALLHGANIVHDVGFMDAGLQGPLQMIAICNDILGFLRAATAGVVVDDETLALDVIEELGPTGSYMGHEHTLRHYKETYYSKLADKNPFSVWQKRGAASMEERAARLVDETLSKHQPEPLSPDIQKALSEVVAREQARLDA